MATYAECLAALPAFRNDLHRDRSLGEMAVPELLRDLSDHISHPALKQVGETKTPDGRWALLATVRRGTSRSDLEK